MVATGSAGTQGEICRGASARLYYTTHWYENDQRAIESIFKIGKINGLYIQWYPNGIRKSESWFQDGNLNGLETTWYPNGQTKTEANYENGKLSGQSIE